jgi:hypothetical protein
MKTLTKISALLVLAIGFTSIAKAQTTQATSNQSIVLSVGAESGISTGEFRHANKWSAGGSLQADFPVANNLYLITNVGYLEYFRLKNRYQGFEKPDFKQLALKTGLKYFPVQRFYVQAAIGATKSLNKFPQDGYSTSIGFIYSPEIGVQLPLGGKNFIDAAAYYEGSTKAFNYYSPGNISSFGVRLAYAFKIK